MRLLFLALCFVVLLAAEVRHRRHSSHRQAFLSPSTSAEWMDDEFYWRSYSTRHRRWVVTSKACGINVFAQIVFTCNNEWTMDYILYEKVEKACCKGRCSKKLLQKFCVEMD
ncbi:hypothetical protein L596_010529 [Steinernema carpocapsae]|uniref:Insulin-like domain-containing protein n=1 Tax=Steinernema carpocapsae TaxID=34508 RepID=A0A4U5PJ66_STECR|nr:hypothetical protein L596_010529 [Steinernema carpocapsae]